MGMIVLTLFVAGVVTLAAAYALVIFAPVHIRWTVDRTGAEPQKFHSTPTPRVGGVAIFGGLVAGGVLLVLRDHAPLLKVLLLVGAALPVFMGGLAEDIGKNFSPRNRLWLSFVAAGLAFVFLDAELRRFDLPVIDTLLQWTPLALVVTVFCIGGVAHAFNIIDGYNGLVAVVGLVVFGALGLVSLEVGDLFVLGVCLTMLGAVLGFLVLNYPRGELFAGDGGAYLVGFMAAASSVLLVARNHNVSAWFPMLLCLYPVWETLFSIYRKRILRGHSSDIPDGLHLHMLIYKRLVRYRIGSQNPRDALMRNSLTSPYLWLLTLIAAVPATIFWNNTPILIGFSIVFVACYCFLYRAIIHFRVPRWLILRSQTQPELREVSG
jgi:UDP-GlcNAc:undecaprenyl-phosphate/decaprenyl-phosphate GlcNAc-1-phosphate transferase